MDILKSFLEQQPLLSMFMVIGFEYALGGVNIRGFSLGAQEFSVILCAGVMLAMMGQS